MEPEEKMNEPVSPDAERLLLLPYKNKVRKIPAKLFLVFLFVAISFMAFIII
jgi:hypothetical protein